MGSEDASNSKMTLELSSKQDLDSEVKWEVLEKEDSNGSIDEMVHGISTASLGSSIGGLGDLNSSFKFNGPNGFPVSAYQVQINQGYHQEGSSIGKLTRDFKKVKINPYSRKVVEACHTPPGSPPSETVCFSSFKQQYLADHELTCKLNGFSISPTWPEKDQIMEEMEGKEEDYEEIQEYPTNDLTKEQIEKIESIRASWATGYSS